MAVSNSLRRRVTITLCLWVVASCTFNVSVDKPELPEAQAPKIPAKVGVYYNADFDHYKIKEDLSIGEDFYLKTDIGPASFAVIDATLRSAFTDVRQVLSVSPAELNDGSIEAVIEPMIKEFDYDVSVGGVTKVLITYEFHVHTLGQQSFSFAVDGGFNSTHWRSVPQRGPIHSYAPKSISAAMRDAATKLLFIFIGLTHDGDWYADLQRQ